MVGQDVRLTLFGLTGGVVGALLFTRLMAGLLFGVKATDPGTFVAVALFLAAIACLSSYLPARRATRVEPMTALRYE